MRLVVFAVLFAVALLAVPFDSRAATAPVPKTTIPPDVRAKLQSFAGASQTKFLAYRATFQLGQIDRHIKLLNVALLKCVNCRTDLQSKLAAATTLRAGIAKTQRPVVDLGRTFIGEAKKIAPGVLPPGPPSGGSNCPVPQITSLSVNNGQPGDPVVINGSGFGSNPGAIQFIGPGGSQYTMSTAYWSSQGTQILAYVPGITGVQAFPGFISVVAPACQGQTQQSNIEQFQFNPEPDTIMLPIPFGTSAAQFGDFTCSPDNCGSNPDDWCLSPQACDYVNGGAFVGKKGHDQFFSGSQLINGWVVSAVDLGNNFPVNSSNGCSISTDSIGSSNPYVDVGCWVSAGGLGTHGIAAYLLSIYITGPTGLPYFP
jgi:hypothetical protein